MVVKGACFAAAAILFSAVLMAHVGYTTDGKAALLRNSVEAEAFGLFSVDYMSARAKFLEAAEAAAARIESYRHPIPGPEGAAIFTDVAVLGSPDAEAVLIIGSGTHGVEGFAGSAIQTGLLRSGYGGLLGPSTQLVLIHAINPFGFAHLRRANEDNVDLNRNFRDHGRPYPPNPGYDALANAVAPESISLFSDIAAISRLLFHAARNGIDATRAAVTSGQHRHPRGLFYGGDAEAWSVKTLRTIVQRHGEGSRKVTYIGVHTGLGPYRQAEIILNLPKKSPAYERAMAWWGGIVRTTKANESVSADLMGTLKLAIPGMLPGATVTAVSLEFGTVSRLAALAVLRTENWQHHHGAEDHPEASRIKTELLRAFYPDADDWRAAVWRQGKEVVDRALLGLAE